MKTGGPLRVAGSGIQQDFYFENPAAEKLGENQPREVRGRNGGGTKVPTSEDGG